MSTKDFKKGMESGAKPFEEKFRKQAGATEGMANDIKEKLDDISGMQYSIIDDLSSIEKKCLYSLNTLVDISEMDDTEKSFLIALLYTIANRSKDITEYQQKFIRSVKNYLGIKSVQSEVDISSIENIESINEQKAILQIIIEFLFLKSANFDFLEELEEEIFDYFSINKKTYNEIKTCISRIYKATGFEGISEKYGYVVIEEMEKDEQKENVANELYDGSDICQECADIININEEYIILDDYLVYHDNNADKTYRVGKRDGEIVEINARLDIDIIWPTFSFSKPMLGCGDNLFLFFNSNKNVFDDEGEVLTKVNINTFNTSKINLIGESRKNHQCNKDYFTYLCKYENADRLVKIDLKNNNIKVLDNIVKVEGFLNCSEYYIVGKSIYLKDFEVLYKFNLDEDTVETICEIPASSYNFLCSNGTGIYKNILFSATQGSSYNQLSCTYLDMENPKAIRNTSVMNYDCGTYSFLAYEYIFYVVLDSNMSIRKYNILTGESTEILETTQCADSYTKGVFKKETNYCMVGSKPQVVGKWLYYLGRTSKNVRKVSIDAKMGESEELLIDGKPVHRFM